MERQREYEVNEFVDLEEAFEQYKKKAGDIKYISCFGKTFLDSEAPEYLLAEKASNVIVNNGFGVLHGGYCGIMEAVSNGAKSAIKESGNRDKYWNIGVPMRVIDKELARSADVNLPTAKDMSDRKKALVEFCDICVVLPSGGFGTILEALEIFHLNQIAEKFGGKIRPIIFMGGNWKKIINFLYENLDMRNQGAGENFVSFINTADELGEILQSMPGGVNQYLTGQM